MTMLQLGVQIGDHHYQQQQQKETGCVLSYFIKHRKLKIEQCGSVIEARGFWEKDE